MSYDQKCYDLAVVFLSDYQIPVQHEDAHKLAQEIQRTIDDHLHEIAEREKNELPSALKLAMERDLDGALAMGKVWGEVFDNLFSPKR